MALRICTIHAYFVEHILIILMVRLIVLVKHVTIFLPKKGFLCNRKLNSQLEKLRNSIIKELTLRNKHPCFNVHNYHSKLDLVTKEMQ
jgi:hypothetical protein